MLYIHICREFTFKKITYTVGNFILLNDESDVEVAKIFCIFINETRRVQLVVRKYIFANDIKELLLKEDSTNFYDSEVCLLLISLKLYNCS